MKRSAVVLPILLAGGLYSGVVATVSHLRLCAEWRRTPEVDREALILGEYAPVVRKVRAQVREEEGILLVSDVDPAPLPYALFPRRIWQTRTEPETSAVFMELPASPYPERPAASFPATWRLDLRKTDMEEGGELRRQRNVGAER